MQTVQVGQTTFIFDPDFSGKIKVGNMEGSMVSVPAEDLLDFVYQMYVVPGRSMQDNKRGWREGLLGR